MRPGSGSQLLSAVVAQTDGGSEASVLFTGLPVKTADVLNRREWNYVRRVSAPPHL